MSSNDVVEFFACLPKSSRVVISKDLELAIQQTEADVSKENPDIEASLLRLKMIKLCLDLTEEEFRELG